VSNADAGFTYSHLLRNTRRWRWTDESLAKKRWSMGLFVWYFGTKGTRGKWADVGHHTVLNGPRYKGLVKDIFFRPEELAEDMSLYIHRPTVTDPSAAPEGDDTFYALSPVPNLHCDNPVDWKAHAESYRQSVQAVMEEKLLPGLGEHVSTSLV
ncbi:phytoene desaturase, partial [Rhodovulum sulfidophilum]|nr:phytoene desaturase [Rhodovulum sulfidophilum]